MTQCASELQSASDCRTRLAKSLGEPRGGKAKQRNGTHGLGKARGRFRIIAGSERWATISAHRRPFQPMVMGTPERLAYVATIGLMPKNPTALITGYIEEVAPIDGTTRARLIISRTAFREFHHGRGDCATQSQTDEPQQNADPSSWHRPNGSQQRGTFSNESVNV